MKEYKSRLYSIAVIARVLSVLYKYQNFELSVLRELCADLILGIDFQSQHSSVVFHYGGSEPPLSVDGLSTLKVDHPPELFVNPTADCHKIASKSRRYSEEDQFCLH